VETAQEARVLAGALKDASIARIVQLARQWLGMDIAFVAEFSHGQRVIRYAVGDTVTGPLEPGSGDPLEESFCHSIAEQQAPLVVHDAEDDPVLTRLPVKQRHRIRAYIGVPVILADGTVYGSLCCFRTTPDETLSEQEVQFLQLLANIIAERVDSDQRSEREKESLRQRLRSLMAEGQPSMVFQPIINITTGKVEGFEALARFTAEPVRGPAAWFAEAQDVGLGNELETAAVSGALAVFPEMPADTYLAVNISADTLAEPGFAHVVAQVPPERLVLELTEQELITDYDHVNDVLEPFRRQGVRVAVDDAGAAHAGLTRILRIAPDALKLDRDIIRSVDADPARRALVTASVSFAREVGMTVIAEGVETAAELETLRTLGVTSVQGFHLARPSPRPWNGTAPRA
jgi:EAL domain-containing protein (putative c-di-GMP-specific phosphodiesterase class I)